jgi:hypothetical protein
MRRCNLILGLFAVATLRSAHAQRPEWGSSNRGPNVERGAAQQEIAWRTGVVGLVRRSIIR